MGRPRKVRLEGETVQIQSEAVQYGFAAAVEQFKTNYPDEWEAIRLCPTQHGIDEMVKKLG